MYIFKSVYNSYKSSESHALKAEPGEVKCKLYFRTEEVLRSTYPDRMIDYDLVVVDHRELIWVADNQQTAACNTLPSYSMEKLIMEEDCSS
jgi:hypothetical protein